MTTMTVQQSAVPTAQTRLSQTLSTQRTTMELDDTAGNTLAEALDTVLHPINGDRVTIGSTPTTGAETTKSEGKATSANAALIPSLRGLFAQFYGGNDTTTVGGSVYDSIANNLNALAELDPEMAKNLAIVLQAIAQIDPEHGKQIFNSLSKAMGSVSSLNVLQPQAQAVAAAQASQAAQAAAIQQQTAQQSVQTVRFTMDLQISQSESFSSTLATLKKQGVEVQTVQYKSSQTVKIHLEFTATIQSAQQCDPLVFDLTGGGIDLTNVGNGTTFDIDADGQQEQTAFVQGGSAFLALDRNGDGEINNGSELFGNQHGAKNGLEELEKFDDNADGVIDAKDVVYNKLRLLWDKNQDGEVGMDELSTLQEQGIASIQLNPESKTRENDKSGNTLAERAAYTKTSGEVGAVVDVWLNNQNTETQIPAKTSVTA